MDQDTGPHSGESLRYSRMFFIGNPIRLRDSIEYKLDKRWGVISMLACKALEGLEGNNTVLEARGMARGSTHTLVYTND